MSDSEDSEVDSEEPVASIKDRAYQNATSLKSLKIPDGVTSIGDNAFEGCTSLASLEIPNSVTSIGGFAFQGCTSLASLKIPVGVTVIRYNTFERCISLKSLKIPKGVAYIMDNAFEGCTLLESIEIPKGVTFIHNSTFNGCTSLKSLTIPDSVEHMDDSAFGGCQSLQCVVWPASVDTKSRTIGNYVFKDCTSLESVEIPGDVVSFGKKAFSGCTSLKSFTIPESVEDISDNSFDGCRSLQSLVLPTSLQKLGKGAFQGCSSLEVVVLPESLTEIGDLPFCDSPVKLCIFTPTTRSTSFNRGIIVDLGLPPKCKLIASDEVVSKLQGGYTDCDNLQDLREKNLLVTDEDVQIAKIAIARPDFSKTVNGLKGTFVLDVLWSASNGFLTQLMRKPHAYLTSTWLTGFNSNELFDLVRERADSGMQETLDKFRRFLSKNKYYVDISSPSPGFDDSTEEDDDELPSQGLIEEWLENNMDHLILLLKARKDLRLLLANSPDE